MKKIKRKLQRNKMKINNEEKKTEIGNIKIEKNLSPNP